MNQPCGWYWCDFLSVSSRACVTTWADPVLPATRMPGSCARQPVPPGATTAAMPCFTAAIVEGLRPRSTGPLNSTGAPFSVLMR